MKENNPRPGSAQLRLVKRGETVNAASPMQRLYLKEMSLTPLLDRQSEVRLATQLTAARLAIRNLAQGLPESCREFVLAGDASVSNPGTVWPLRRLEAFFRKLVRFAAQHPHTEAPAALREIRAHKASLDDARNGLVLANLRLVVHFAGRYGNKGLPLMDLIQEGNLGLLTAVEKFDHERGNRFATYASWWIRQAIEGGIAEKSRTIRIPAQVSEEIRKVEFAARDLSQHLGRNATPREIARRLSVPVGAVDQTLAIVREPCPLEAGVGDREGLNVARFVPDAQTPSPFHDAAQREIKERVASVLLDLSHREQAIIRMRFGLGHEAGRTLAEIGERLRLSRERVRQIEAAALTKIKASPLCRELAELFGVAEPPFRCLRG